MKEVDWDILADLFEKALDLSPEERTAFLEKACKGKEDLRLELDSLLASFEEAPAFFGSLGHTIPSLSIEEALIKEPAVKEPLVDPHNFVGKKVKNYKILGVLGIGGMGVVYRAEDVELHRPVALKFLPPSLSNDTKARERFITEARAASGLDQTNICTIHEIGRTNEGLIFIAMAYYKGETLKHLIDEGNLPASQALNYATQLCRGLCRAHASNIVHRDIKPANIMVTEDGVVKILDFGLAKMANQQLTQTGQTMGTVTYMSPEQARGEPTDQRTDIWSLGVLLYEMITGERPFKGDYAQSTIYSILNEEPDPVEGLNANVSQTTVAIINRCLEKNPDERYQTADELLQDLEPSFQQPVIVQNQDASKHIYLVALVAIVLIGLVISIPSLREKITGSASSDGPLSNEMRLAVLPFQGLPEEDEENQVLAAGLMHVVASLLPQLDSPEKPLWVVPINEVNKSGVQNASMASEFLGAKLAINGDVKKRDNVVSLSLKLINSENEQLLGAESSLIDESTIVNPLDTEFHEQIIESLANLLGLEITPETRRTIENAMPEDPDAYAFYVTGLGYLERFDKEGYIDHAIQQFSASINADSLFAPAHAGLCEATVKKFRLTNEPALAGQSLSSCNKAVELSADDPAVLTALGSFLLYTSDMDLAKNTLRSAIELDPENSDAYRWLGRVYEKLAIPDSALTQYLKAIELKPGRWTYYSELGIFYQYQGNIEAAAAQFENVKNLTPDNYKGYTFLAVAKTYLYEDEEAESLYLKAIELNDNAVEALRNLGRLYLIQNQYDKAIEKLQQGVALNDFVSRSYLAHALYWSGDKAQAITVWEDVVEIARTRISMDLIDGEEQIMLADALIALGKFEEAGPEIEEAKAYVKAFPALASFYLGRMYERLGNRTVALDYLEDAFEARAHFYSIDQDPWLKDLRTEARYKAMRDKYRPNN